MSELKNKTIGEWVAQDYRTAAVFKKHSIDFCCQGNRSIQSACESNGIELAKVMEDIGLALRIKKDSGADYKTWPIDLLADYIEKKHHRYVAASIPVLKQYLQKICSVHGHSHPELLEILELFNHSADELTTHMKKEELMVFPVIREMVSLNAIGKKSVKNPIQVMMHEHDTEGERFRKISSLSNYYTPPSDGCNTYKVAYELLKEFEEDLHIHIHLENNILFPKAIELEKKISTINN